MSKQKEKREIDYYKLSLYIFKGVKILYKGSYKILCATMKAYKSYRERKDLKTYIKLREKFINIACSDDQYKKDMSIVDMANYKPKNIVEMQDYALKRYIERQIKGEKNV